MADCLARLACLLYNSRKRVLVKLLPHTRHARCRARPHARCLMQSSNSPARPLAPIMLIGKWRLRAVVQ